MRSREFFKLQREWYGKLERSGFFDIEAGCEHTDVLRSSLGGDTARFSLNAVQAASGRPMVQLDSFQRGSEWEELVSETDRNVDMRRSPTGTYVHFAQLIASQEYELCRLGTDRRASRTRLAWALHSQGVSEREIARACETSRHEIRKYIAQLDTIIHAALDNAA